MYKFFLSFSPFSLDLFVCLFIVYVCVPKCMYMQVPTEVEEGSPGLELKVAVSSDHHAGSESSRPSARVLRARKE